MADPFVAEIRIFPFNFPPKGWAFCNGQLLPITQNTALFALVGTMYGGDGKSTFGLPNLQGRAPMHHGEGPGLTYHDVGESAGTETVTLLSSEIPVHTHAVQAEASAAVRPGPSGNVPAVPRLVNAMYQSTATALAPMAPEALAPAGGSLPHDNMQPYLTLNFCIAMQGVFPPRW